MKRTEQELAVDGFHPLASLRDRLARGGRHALMLSTPALVVVEVARTQTRGGGDDLAYARTVDHDQANDADTGGSPKQYLDRVAFLQKRKGNPFPNMVSLGRARNQDVCLALGTVSKVHCYFVKGVGGDWSIVDQRSRNGTFLNDQPLVPSQSTLLDDQAVLRFGDEVTARFLLVDSFLDLLAARA
jgi:FHA domain